MLISQVLKQSLYKADTEILEDVSLEGYGTIDKYLSTWIYNVKSLFTDTLFGDRLTLVQNKPTDSRYVLDALGKDKPYAVLSDVEIDIPKNLDVVMQAYFKVLVDQLGQYNELGTEFFHDVTEYLDLVITDNQQASKVFVSKVKLPDLDKMKKELSNCFNVKNKQAQTGLVGNYHPSEKLFNGSYDLAMVCFDRGTAIDLNKLKKAEDILIEKLVTYQALITEGTIEKTKQGSGEVIRNLEEIRDLQEYLAVLFERTNGAIAIWNIQTETMRKSILPE